MTECTKCQEKPCECAKWEQNKSLYKNNKLCKHDNYSYQGISLMGEYIFECNECDGVIYNSTNQIPKLGKDLVKDEYFIMLEYSTINRKL